MRGSVRARLLVVLAMSLVVFAVAPGLAHAAASWQSGTLQESMNFDCITGDPEYEAGTFLSYYADPANPPQVGQVFYVALDMTGIGDPCAGIYADAHLVLPSSLSLAVSATHPVRCFFQLPGKAFQQDSSSDCPQNLPFEAFAGGTGFRLNPNSVNPPFWPLPSGLTIEVQVPVVASAAMVGTPPVQAAVELADGQSDPTLVPSLNVIVNPANSQNVGGKNEQIGVVYQNPSISGQSESGTGPVTATFTGFVQNNSNAGTAVAQLAKANGPGNCSNPGIIFTSNSAALQNPNTQISGNFTGLYPGGAYCWRIVATVTGGVAPGTYDGNWRYFATIGTYTGQPANQFTPLADKPTGVTSCSTNGSGCATSTCNTSTCTTGNGIADFSHKLTISLGGTGGGSVSGTGNISCAASCAQTYPSSSSPKITLSATPSAGSTFTGWGGACSGTGTCTVTMNANQTVTATFTLIPKPPPPKPTPPPSCSVSSVSSHVLLHAHKRSQRKQVGLLNFHVRCDQNASVALSGKLTETLGRKHGKLVTKSASLGPTRGSVRAGLTSTLSLTLDRAEMAALGRHFGESLAVTLVATNGNGRSQARTSIAKLKGTG